MRTSTHPCPAWRVGALALLLVLTVDAGPARAAGQTQAGPTAAVKFASSRVKASEWLKCAAGFLVLAGAGGYVWYSWYFPRLLRKKNPSWPLDAWRQATYGAWVTACLVTLVFHGPLMRTLKPHLQSVLSGVPNESLRFTLSEFFMVLVLIPLVLLVGLVVIWNFRRDDSHRATGLSAASGFHPVPI